jgi:hypothetical protein
MCHHVQIPTYSGKKKRRRKSPSAVKSKQAGYCFGNFDKGCDSILVLGRLGAAREEPLT